MKRASRLATFCFAIALLATMGQGLILTGWFSVHRGYIKRIGHKFYPAAA